jgi:cbb3-type cytochrome oxidase maturation protein
MTVLYLIVPLALLIAGVAVAAFAWTVHSGQLDDVDTPPRRILFDERSEAGGGDPDGFAGGAGGSAPRGIDERAAIARCAPPAAGDAPERGRRGHSGWHSS